MGGVKIEDGTGNGFKARVTVDKRLDTSSRSNPRSYYVSRDKARVFNSTSDLSSASSGDYVLYIKNTSETRNLFVGTIEYHSTEAVQWKVWEVTGTPAGASLVSPKNLNLGSGTQAEAEVYADAAITGLITKGGAIGVHRTDVNGAADMSFGDALILSPQTAIAIEYHNGTSGACEIDCFMYYEDVNIK
jgi:hypothetical protein